MRSMIPFSHGQGVRVLPRVGWAKWMFDVSNLADDNWIISWCLFAGLRAEGEAQGARSELGNAFLIT